MINSSSILAIIPARGGSKGIPHKNIVDLGGKPLICHTFDQIECLDYIDSAVVSTDCPQIKEVSERCGIRVIDRPSELATDTSRTEDCLLHCLSVLEQEEKYYDYIVILEPTSPFRTPSSISKCVYAAIQNKASSLLTIKRMTENVGTLKDGQFVPIDNKIARRRQDRNRFYSESSTVYVVKVSHLRRHKTIVSPDWMAIVIDESECIDINTPIDLETARSYLNIKGGC